MKENKVSDCFPLNGNIQNANIQGVDQVLDVYQKNLQKIKFGGPTRFAPLIRKAREQVEEQNVTGAKLYHILMILTDGEIHDLKETIEEIDHISTNYVPLSIVIVGVGNDDFSNMLRLDGDEFRIKDGCRDLV